MSVAEPRPNPETVTAIHDIVWRVASAETSRTEELDRKAATLATFASLLTTLTATLGLRFVESLASWWALGLFVAALAVLGTAVVEAVRALEPKEYLALGTAFLERLPTWSVVLRPPEHIRGETVRGLIESIAQERRANDAKADRITSAFRFLLFGLGLLIAEAITLGMEGVSR
jgi:hypothetical protein